MSHFCLMSGNLIISRPAQSLYYFFSYPSLSSVKYEILIFAFYINHSDSTSTPKSFGGLARWNLFLVQANFYLVVPGCQAAFHVVIHESWIFLSHGFSCL